MALAGALGGEGGPICVEDGVAAGDVVQATQPNSAISTPMDKPRSTKTVPRILPSVSTPDEGGDGKALRRE